MLKRAWRAIATLGPGTGVFLMVMAGYTAISHILAAFTSVGLFDVDDPIGWDLLVFGGTCYVVCYAIEAIVKMGGAVVNMVRKTLRIGSA